jgi:molecular chaperone GrpE (heat shock protein)
MEQIIKMGGNGVEIAESIIHEAETPITTRMREEKSAVPLATTEEAGITSTQENKLAVSPETQETLSKAQSELARLNREKDAAETEYNQLSQKITEAQKQLANLEEQIRITESNYKKVESRYNELEATIQDDIPEQTLRRIVLGFIDDYDNIKMGIKKQAAEDVRRISPPVETVPAKALEEFETIRAKLDRVQYSQSTILNKLDSMPDAVPEQALSGLEPLINRVIASESSLDKKQDSMQVRLINQVAVSESNLARLLNQVAVSESNLDKNMKTKLEGVINRIVDFERNLERRDFKDLLESFSYLEQVVYLNKEKYQAEPFFNKVARFCDRFKQSLGSFGIRAIQPEINELFDSDKYERADEVSAASGPKLLIKAVVACGFSKDEKILLKPIVAVKSPPGVFG